MTDINQGQAMYIRLTNGVLTLIDESDYSKVSRCNWYYRKTHGKEYAYRLPRQNGRYVTLYLHRFLTNAGRNQKVDHVNGNGLDNRRSNLRLCSNEENLRNRGKTRINSSGYKGVTRGILSHKWLARIGYKGKNIHLGSFSDIEEAARAYDSKARELFGEFALLNFPEGE